jgi:hypothetical protein
MTGYWRMTETSMAKKVSAMDIIIELEGEYNNM